MSDLQTLRIILTKTPRLTVEEIQAVTGWEKLRAQRAVGSLLSSGLGISLPKRYEVARHETERAKYQKEQMRLLRERTKTMRAQAKEARAAA